MAVRPEQVFSVSADPFGLVGNQDGIIRTSYLDQNRVWDGIASLVAPLLAVDDPTARRLHVHSSMDTAIAAIRGAREHYRDEGAAAAQESAAGASVDAALVTAVAELAQLRQSITARAQQVVDEHADDVIGEALGAGPQDIEAMAENLAEWWTDPRLAAAVKEFEPEAKREIEQWYDNNRSQIGRRVERMEFAASSIGFTSAARRPGATSESHRAASTVLRESSKLASSLGNRDAIYGIGKALEHKFPPWGAVKGGARMARAGAVLGAFATAFDIYTWVRDIQQENTREAARKQGVDYVRATTPGVLDHILTGGKKRPGPNAYLDIQASGLADLQHTVSESRGALDDTVAEMSAKVALCDELLAAAARIDPTYQEEIA